jgi:hypothetical protein
MLAGLSTSPARGHFVVRARELLAGASTSGALVGARILHQELCHGRGFTGSGRPNGARCSCCPWVRGISGTPRAAACSLCGQTAVAMMRHLHQQSDDDWTSTCANTPKPPSGESNVQTFENGLLAAAILVAAIKERKLAVKTAQRIQCWHVAKEDDLWVLIVQCPERPKHLSRWLHEWSPRRCSSRCGR